jgi:peptidoglycan/LPS O-acetylase OafA/YrhL
MKYVVRTFIAMFLFAFCWVAIGYGINQMLQIGTCASGGPYVVARECPDGTTAIFFALFLGILGLFVAAGIYLTRGTPPGGPPPQNAGIILWFWTGIFWSLAIGCFLAVWGPEANPGPGGKEGGLIVGFMGLIMGAGGIGAVFLGKPKRRRPKIPQLVMTAPVEPPGADRIEELARLRNDGSLTRSEFDTLKAKIMRED